MRYVFILILSVCALFAQAQQVNPVPDYTFANRMSAGRNTVTDTAAYFSIGPRYGAIRGMMPPIVVDTAAVSGNKRNGLLIFSVQKNKFLYWDSVRVQWSDMAGSSGSYIVAGDTATMLSPYVRGSGTTNYIPKFASTRSLSNSSIYDDGEIKINTAADSGDYKLQINGSFYSNYGNYIRGNPTDKTRALSISGDPLTVTLWLEEYNTGGGSPDIFFRSGQGTLFAKSNSAIGNNLGGINWAGYVDGTFSPSVDFTTSVVNIDLTNKRADANLTLFQTYNSAAQVTARYYALTGGMYVRGETLLGSETDYGAHQLQVTGSIYNTTGAVLAASSGNVGIGGAPSTKFHVYGATTLGGYTELNSSNAASSYLNMGYGGANKSYWGSAAGFDAGTADEYLIGTLANSTFNIYTNAIRRITVTGGGQVGISQTSPNASAQLDVTSTTRGFLPPRMTTTQRDAISSPAAGLVIYNTTTSKLQVYTTSWTDLH
jgi:hypothetical protein